MIVFSRVYDVHARRFGTIQCGHIGETGVVVNGQPTGQNKTFNDMRPLRIDQFVTIADDHGREWRAQVAVLVEESSMQTPA